MCWTSVDFVITGLNLEESQLTAVEDEKCSRNRLYHMARIKPQFSYPNYSFTVTAIAYFITPDLILKFKHNFLLFDSNEINILRVSCKTVKTLRIFGVLFQTLLNIQEHDRKRLFRKSTFTLSLVGFWYFPFISRYSCGAAGWWCCCLMGLEL